MSGLAAVIRSPGKIALLLGGSAVVTLSYVLAVYFSTVAFGGGLDLAQVGAAYLVGSAIATAAPTPGGLGALEAAVIAGLVGAGMAEHRGGPGGVPVPARHLLAPDPPGLVRVQPPPPGGVRVAAPVGCSFTATPMVATSSSALPARARQSVCASANAAKAELRSTSSTTTTPPAGSAGHTCASSKATFRVVCMLSWTNRSTVPSAETSAGRRRRLDPSRYRHRRSQPLGHRDRSLGPEPRLEERWDVDAPEVAATVPLECLQHDAGGDPAGNTGLDDELGSCVQRRAPHGSRERSVAVVPTAVRAATDLQPSIGERRRDAVVQRPELVVRRARPRLTEELV